MLIAYTLRRGSKEHVIGNPRGTLCGMQTGSTLAHSRMTTVTDTRVHTRSNLVEVGINLDGPGWFVTTFAPSW